MKLENTIFKDSIEIKNQIWQPTNLNVSYFRNGDTIYHAESFEEWIKACDDSIPAWIYYENIKDTSYGKFYNWFAVVDKRGLAPFGWRVPTYKDFLLLEKNLGGREIDFCKLAKIDEWPWPSDFVNEKTEFNAYPSGEINSKGFAFRGGSAVFLDNQYKK